MKQKLLVALLALGVATFLFENRSIAQSDLIVAYGNNGLQQLSYKGVRLEDTNQYPADTFHIWHMKLTDLNGNVLTNGQYGWGESNNGKSWDGASHTWTYNYVWGTIKVQFAQSGNTLNLNVSEVNAPGSGVILDGAVIYPMVLHFPQLPSGFYDANYSQLAFNTTGPSVTVADFGAGEVAAVMPDAAKPLYSGFLPNGQSNAYFPIISGTSLDGMAAFQPHLDRPLAPGHTDNFTVSLRFAPSGTAAGTLASDAYQSWARTWPAQLNWADRRVIGTLYLASSPPSGPVNRPGGFPNNPRRYFNDGNASDFDVKTLAGLKKFQTRVLQQAANNVGVMRQLGAQGAITWDLEGQEYPQETSYVCSPDQVGQVAPEMESVISDPNSQYAGMKLDDAYFKTMRDAGFRVGVCVRPQHFTLNRDGTAQQVYLANADIASEIIRKMKYAHDRWGATLFYIDSTVELNGAVLDASIFQQAAAALSDSLLIPEETTAKYYAYVAAFKTFLFHGDLGTDSAVYNYYPKAFSVTLVNDVDPTKLAAAQAQLTQAVAHGDILMAHAGYWQANNSTIVQIYHDAGVSPAPPVATVTPPDATPPVVTPPVVTPPVVTPSLPPPPPIPVPVTNPTPTPAPIAPSKLNITSPQGHATVSGMISATADVNINLDSAGTYLMVDGIEIGTRRVTSSPYVYPLDTGTLSDGEHQLQLWARDQGGSTVLSEAVQIAVNNGVGSSLPLPTLVTSAPVTPVTPVTPVAPVSTAYPITLTYPVSGQAISGVISVGASIGQTLDSAGSYLLLDGVEYGTRRIGSAPYLYELNVAALSPGQHVLQIWAHDTGDSTLLSNAVTITAAP